MDGRAGGVGGGGAAAAAGTGSGGAYAHGTSDSGAPAWVRDVPALVEALDAHEPALPDDVVAALLQRSGCNVNDNQV
jgi:hypothetical protein